MISQSEFKPAWWLASAHGQTVYPTLARFIQSSVDKTERVELPDGDFIDLAWAINGVSPGAPLVILLHGLGGNSRSTYVAGLMRAINQQGWRAVLMHFRGASDESNRLPRAYHSGDTSDLDYVVNLVHQREPETKKAAVGVSLGGNVLLKWLGEQGSQSVLTTAVAVSVPFQLRIVANKMTEGFSRVYQRYLLHNLRRVFNRKKVYLRHELPPALQHIDKWRCFWTFDENVTAPLHGFSNVHAYYRQASCYTYLHTIRTPTLIIHSKDDPFMTQDALPHHDDLSSWVNLELSDKGGHVGFISGNFPGKPFYWLETRIPIHLSKFFSSNL